MSHRIAQIEATLKKTIAQVLMRDLADPRVDGFVSITRVKVTPDLRDATVYVSVMPAEKQSKNLHGLRHAAGHIRSLVLKRMTIRAIPRLRFEADESLKKQAAVFDAIRRASEKTRSDAPQDDLPDPTDTINPDPAETTGEEDGTK